MIVLWIVGIVFYSMLLVGGSGAAKRFAERSMYDDFDDLDEGEEIDEIEEVDDYDDRRGRRSRDRDDDDDEYDDDRRRPRR